MLSSANYQREDGVLNAGQEVVQEISQEFLNDPKTTVFYNHVPHSRFVMPDGAELKFHGGMFATQSDDIKKELNKIANKAGSLVFTLQKARDQIQEELKKVAEDARTIAADANKLSSGVIAGAVQSEGTRK